LFIVNLALPRIGEAFTTASPQAVSWVLNAYTVAAAALGRLHEQTPADEIMLVTMGFSYAH